MPRVLTRRAALIISLGAIALIATLSAPGVGASAATGGTFSLRPDLENDFFHISLFPGAAIDATAIAANETDSALTLERYPVDGTTSADGTFLLGSQTSSRVGIGAWVTMDTSPLLLASGQKRRLPFRLTVPVGTSPGDYAGGLIVQGAPELGNAAALQNGDSMQLRTIHRVGVRIYLTVAGTAITSATHGGLSWTKAGKTLTFSLPVHNSGNTTLHPVATMAVSSGIGLNTRLRFTAPESLLPGATIILQAHRTNLPMVEYGSASATVRSEAGDLQARTSVIFAPILLLIGIGIGLAVITYGAWRVVRFIRNNSHLINWS